MRYGVVIDSRKCIGCHSCTVACKTENRVPLGVNRTWVKYVEKGRFPHARRIFQVTRCSHCEKPPCVEICPVTAMYQRRDGIVDFNPARCIGCKACMQACPYDAIYVDPDRNTAAKCHLCAHRVEVGLEPACAAFCPEHALIAGDLDNPESEVAQLLARETVRVRKPEQGTQPKTFYIDADESTMAPPRRGMNLSTCGRSGTGKFTAAELPIFPAVHFCRKIFWLPMIHDAQRPSRSAIDQSVPQLLCQCVAVAIHDVAGVDHMLWNLEPPAASLPEPPVHALVQPRLMVIHLQAFVVNCERCHARGGDIFNADFGRDRPQTRCYQQRTFDRDKVAVRRKARAARALRLRAISSCLPSQPEQIVDAANEELGPRIDSTQNAARRKKKIVFRDLFHSLGSNHRCPHVCFSFVYPSR